MTEEIIIPNLQKKRIIECLNGGKRFDNRKFEEYRELLQN
jgi:exosome complex RNA-binding protein Rrp42 (RNase PH superfamily)